MQEANENKAIIDFATTTLGGVPRTLKGADGCEISVVELPGGRQLHSVKALIDEYRKAPEFRHGRAWLASIDSLIEHANRFKNQHSALFADPDWGKPAGEQKPKLVSVIDYHDSGPNGSARFCKHRGVYEFPLSEPWKRWAKHDRHEFQMAEFAAFLEDSIVEVADPTQASEEIESLVDKLEVRLATPAALMTAARGLSIKVEHNVHSHRNLASGEMEIMFDEKHSPGAGGGGKVNVPQAFLLGMPVFRGGDFFMLAARLRYRVKGAAITFSYQLHRPDQVFDFAFNEACKKAQLATELPLFFGTPE